MVRPNSVTNNLTRITKPLQAWQINWNIHGVHIPLANPVNNLAIPYEVLVDGRPTDPLSDDRLAEAAEKEVDDTAALLRLTEARALLTENLDSEIAQTTTERL